MSYNLLTPVKIFTNANMSSTLTSPPVEIKYQDNVGIQMTWTGAPQGSFAVQISSSSSQLTNTNTWSWINLPYTPTITAVGSADSAYIDLIQLSAMYVRLVYTPTAGTGTLNALVVGKGI